MELHENNTVLHHRTQTPQQPGHRPHKVVPILRVGQHARPVRKVTRQGEQEEEEG